MLEVQSQENQPKKLPIFISENSLFFFFFFLGVKVDFQKNKIKFISAKLQKILW
jgi:hypothetical protein